MRSENRAGLATMLPSLPLPMLGHDDNAPHPPIQLRSVKPDCQTMSLSGFHDGHILSVPR